VPGSSARVGTPGGAGSATQSAQPARGATTPTSPNGAADGDKTGIKIVADEINNALVILSNENEYRMIEAALQRLDIVPLQVLIEATIAEVTLNDQLRYGLQWFFSAGSSDLSFTPNETGVIAPVFPGFNYVFSNVDARVVLNALSDVTDVNVLSAPQLVVLDNRTARLSVGDQVPIPLRSSVSTIDPNAPIINDIDYRDTGVILRITPRVNAGGLVNLNIAQEVSDVTRTVSSNIDAPTIQQRTIQSTVAVHDGDSVALGGLIRDIRSNGATGIPVLSNIPILGNLFKTTTEQQRRTELLILITPRVIGSRAQAQAVTEELRRLFSGLDTGIPRPHRVVPQK
jgi:general secretion pathway protein D